MGDQVNILIDDLWMVLLRIFELPIAFQAFLWIFVSSFFWLLTFKLLGSLRKNQISESLKIYIYSSTTIFVLVIGAIAINDFQLHKLELDKKPKQEVVILKDTASSDLYFQKYFNQLNKIQFSKVTSINYLQADKGLEIIRIDFKDPLNVIFLATIDLTMYKVDLDTAISTKKRTARVGAKHDWDIAVNGEAGTAPARDAPLGGWIGNYIVNGQPFLLEDSKYHPFIYFDKEGKVYYSKESEVIKKPTEQMYNAIWGRFDMMMNGENAQSIHDYTADNYFPRTIVGMNKDGNRMFLMVADGRKPLYSIGLKIPEAIEIFKAVNVYHAMACDQGGSSLMYSKKLGVVNRPSDGGERAVYTHLGFKKIQP